MSIDRKQNTKYIIKAIADLSGEKFLDSRKVQNLLYLEAVLGTPIYYGFKCEGFYMRSKELEQEYPIFWKFHQKKIKPKLKIDQMLLKEGIRIIETIAIAAYLRSLGIQGESLKRKVWDLRDWIGEAEINRAWNLYDLYFKEAQDDRRN